LKSLKYILFSLLTVAIIGLILNGSVRHSGISKIRSIKSEVLSCGGEFGSDNSIFDADDDTEEPGHRQNLDFYIISSVSVCSHFSHLIYLNRQSGRSFKKIKGSASSFPMRV
jgi:hypothetical protein